MSFSQWPAPARAIALAVQGAVLAAQGHDRVAFEEAVVETRALDAEHLRIVLGSVVQMLLQETQPDGLGADDLQALLENCVKNTSVWTDEPDIDVLVFVIGGALGMQDPDEEPPTADPAKVTSHAIHLVVELLSITKRPLAGYLDAAIGEIARDQTMEMP